MHSSRCGSNGRIWNLSLLSLLSLVMICASSGSMAEETPSLAILPFTVEKAEDRARGAVCPVCKGIYGSGDVVAGGPIALTRELYQKVEALGTFRVIPLEKVEEARSGSAQMRIETNPLRSAIPLAKELNADFVMVCHLFRFEQRVGSSIGVEKPASIAFDLHLFRIKDGAQVWDGNFDETQKALFDNLLQAGAFFKGGAKWVTAEELASLGINKLLKKLPDPRELIQKP